MTQMVHHTENPPIGTLHEVRASFSDADAMQDAVTRLEISGFDRADLSLPDPAPAAAIATPEQSAKPADTEEDSRQARTLHTSGAAAAVGMAAAGVVIATGGAAAPAVAAAVLGGGAAGGLAYAISSIANQDEQVDREQKAASGDLILSVRAPTPEKRAQAERILRTCGGTAVEVQ